jgi:hypothetical protein
MRREAYIAFLKLVAICGTVVIAGTPILIALFLDVLISRILGISNLSEAFEIQVWRLLIFLYVQYLVITLIISITYNTSKVLYKHRDLFLL